MPMPSDEIAALIKAAIPDATVEMEALVDDNDHWLARVTSAEFAGKSRVQQHKMVFAALGERMGGELHALQLHTSVPN
ncbi:BolA/IbaG family iron-sulfur metabolism protein [Aurantiacibacter gangjinensis]|uniref:ATP-binding protein n=1 Tax=Aurantiacibacter gangjinensis TaxID=502682 RepID=A0A0G9MVU5_9SPHN|nr:BolA/IbaG family iron-sulfur metabolism protein [Aurantiacibacter gangjinensis]APE26950.1 YrbA protein [Aurantiacibacter gangjinensis]KLE33403.1 ATP-binding protein [Aurantiacibacter gangjinensis]